MPVDAPASIEHSQRQREEGGADKPERGEDVEAETVAESCDRLHAAAREETAYFSIVAR